MWTTGLLWLKSCAGCDNAGYTSAKATRIQEPLETQGIHKPKNTMRQVWQAPVSYTAGDNPWKNAAAVRITTANRPD
jgi:hypothetical protein